MLDGMRKAAQGGIGRLIMVLVMGLIIFSFVVWGIGDMLRGFTSDKVATVGSASITAQQFQSEFQNVLYQYQRRSKVPLTGAQARAAGIDQQVLQRLIDEAALDQRTASLGLSISDLSIADAARADPQMKDASGNFNRALFDQALRDSGLTERAFFAKQKQIYLRQQLEYSLVNGFKAPKALLAALDGIQSQTRTIDYFTLPASAAGEIATPGADTLKTYSEDRKGEYRAPEYRAINLLLVSPASIAKPGDVTDEDAKAVYEKSKDTRFTSPEKRKLQQIVFPNESDAVAADARLKAGESFDDLAKERKLGDTDLDLGEISKTDIFDPAIGEAAFALPAPGVTGVVKGKFGFLLLRVVSITSGAVKPYDYVAKEIKTGIATSRASSDVQAIHDKIEDARVSGKPLTEAAKAVGLEARTIDAVDSSGLDPKGQAMDVPEKGPVLRAVFASDVGVDDAAVNTKDRGYVWFDVVKVEPARDRTLDEVKDKVEAAWRAEETQKALSARAADFVKQIDAGATVQALAQTAGVEAKTAAGIKRSGGIELPETLVNAVFAVGPDRAGSARTPEGRVVFKISADATPAYDAAAPGAKTSADRLNDAMQSDFVEQYLAALKRTVGVKINMQVLQAAEGP